MIRVPIVIALSALLLAGCEKYRQPTRRDVSETPEPANPHGGMSPGMSLPSTEGPEVRLGSMALTAPDGWLRKQPRMRMITLAEFALPRVEGDPADGRLTVTAVGGSVKDNVARWRSQFQGELKQQEQSQIEVAGVQLATIDLLGTFNDQHGTSAPATQLPDYRMRAAIFTIKSQQFIVKCYGPEKTMADQDEQFMAFLQSLKPAKPRSAMSHPPMPKTGMPKTGEPKTGMPKTGEPEPTETKSTETKSTEPGSTEPGSTEPESTEPKSTEPKSTEPESTEPGPTEPESTDSPG